MEKKLVAEEVVSVDPSNEVIDITVESKPQEIRTLRNMVLRFAGNLPFTSDTLDDIELAVGEACSNAIRHGSPKGSEDTITLKCSKCERHLEIEVSDNGCGFNPAQVPSPNPNINTRGGMGIFLMHKLMDRVEFEFHSGTVVRLIKLFGEN